MTLWLVATGVISMLGQVVLLRELNVAFYGTELIYVLALGVWLLWTATGARLGWGSSASSPGRVRWLLVALAWLLPLTVVFIRGLRPLFGAVPGAYLPFPRQILAMTLSLAPVGLSLGLLFVWAAKLFVGRGRTLAVAYALESAGGILGGALATAFLKFGLQNFLAGLLCAAGALLVALVPVRGRRARRFGLAAGITLVVLAGAMAVSSPLDRRLTGWTHPLLLGTRDSPYGRVTVTGSEGQVSVYENDALVFESQGTQAERLADLAALQRPHPRTMLVLGGGVEGLCRELLRHHPRRVDYVELNRVLLDLVSAHLPRDVAASLRSPGVHVHLADPRRFLDRPGSYDLIVVGMPGPGSGQTNRFYTREFFSLCARRMNPGGVLALRLRGAENLWSPQRSRRTGSVYRSLKAVFPDVVALPGVTELLFASAQPLCRDPDTLAARLVERGIHGRLVIPAYIHYIYTNDRFFSFPQALQRTKAPPNTDVRPICYSYTLLVWLSRFFPVLAVLNLPEPGLWTTGRSPWAWLALIAVLLALWRCRRRRSCSRAMLAATGGFVGMVLETALLLNYQTNRGVLFQDLGLLLMLFMAGLAAGAWLADAASRSGRRLGRGAGWALVAALAGVAGLTAWAVPAGWAAGLLGTGALLVASGFLVAAVFSYASLRGKPEQEGVVSPLYAADLAGGCLGSVAASLFLVPVLGLAGSALVAAGVGLVVMVLV